MPKQPFTLDNEEIEPDQLLPDVLWLKMQRRKEVTVAGGSLTIPIHLDLTQSEARLRELVAKITQEFA